MKAGIGPRGVALADGIGIQQFRHLLVSGDICERGDLAQIDVDRAESIARQVVRGVLKALLASERVAGAVEPVDDRPSPPPGRWRSPPSPCQP